MASALQIFHTPRLESERAPGLSPRGNGDARLAGEGGNVDFAPEGRLNEADRHFAGEVPAVAAEDLVFLHMNHDVQIAVGRATDTGSAVAGGT